MCGCKRDVIYSSRIPVGESECWNGGADGGGNLPKLMGDPNAVGLLLKPKPSPNGLAACEAVVLE